MMKLYSKTLFILVMFLSLNCFNVKSDEKVELNIQLQKPRDNISLLNDSLQSTVAMTLYDLRVEELQNLPTSVDDVASPASSEVDNGKFSGAATLSRIITEEANCPEVAVSIGFVAGGIVGLLVPNCSGTKVSVMRLSLRAFAGFFSGYSIIIHPNYHKRSVQLTQNGMSFIYRALQTDCAPTDEVLVLIEEALVLLKDASYLLLEGSMHLTILSVAMIMLLSDMIELLEYEFHDSVVLF